MTGQGLPLEGEEPSQGGAAYDGLAEAGRRLAALHPRIGRAVSSPRLAYSETFAAGKPPNRGFRESPGMPSSPAFSCRTSWRSRFHPPRTSS